MAIISWSNKVRHSSYKNEPYNFDIHDWRLIRYGLVVIEEFKRQEVGVYISAKENIRFIPHLTIPQVMCYNSQGRDFHFEGYHVGYRGYKHALTYCFKCRGAGKFDWIQMTSVAKRFKWGDAPKHFVRDESVYYMYPGFDNYLFARVKLEPGDEYCQECQGLGISLDGRHGLYKGMKGIKHKLFPVDAQEYNDKLKLKGLMK